MGTSDSQGTWRHVCSEWSLVGRGLEAVHLICRSLCCTGEVALASILSATGRRVALYSFLAEYQGYTRASPPFSNLFVRMIGEQQVPCVLLLHSGTAPAMSVL